MEDVEKALIRPWTINNSMMVVIYFPPSMNLCDVHVAFSGQMRFLCVVLFLFSIHYFSVLSWNLTFKVMKEGVHLSLLVFVLRCVAISGITMYWYFICVSVSLSFTLTSFNTLMERFVYEGIVQFFVLVYVYATFVGHCIVRVLMWLGVGLLFFLFIKSFPEMRYCFIRKFLTLNCKIYGT